MSLVRKRELISRIREQTGLPSDQVRVVVDAAVEILRESLADQREVVLRNLGRFHPSIYRRGQGNGSGGDEDGRYVRVNYRPPRSLKQEILYRDRLEREAKQSEPEES